MKDQIMNLVAEYAAEKILSSDGLLANDKAATIVALHHLIGAALEGMGEEAPDAVNMVKETMKNAAINAAGVVAEILAEDAEYDSWAEEYTRPDWADSCELCAWDQFNEGFKLGVDLEAEYEEAHTAALPGIDCCNIHGNFPKGDDCPQCTQEHFEWTHSAGRV